MTCRSISWSCGGYVGCEFAQVFARFGARVTVVQRGKRLLPSEDPDVSAVVEQAFRDEGIDVLTGTACTSVTNADNAVRVICQGVETAELSATHLLIAAGRVPNSDDLGLEHPGLAVGEGGFVAVDENLHAGADDVWALGDLRGGLMFTHTARDDADVVYRLSSGPRSAPLPGVSCRTPSSSIRRSPPSG